MRFAATFLETYAGLIGRTRFLSQAATFLVFLVTFLTLGDLFYHLFVNAPAEFWRENSSDIGVAIGFQLLIGIVFLGRFGFLSVKRDKALPISQFLWLLGILSIYFYSVATRGYLFSETGY